MMVNIRHIKKEDYSDLNQLVANDKDARGHLDISVNPRDKSWETDFWEMILVAEDTKYSKIVGFCKFSYLATKTSLKWEQMYIIPEYRSKNDDYYNKPIAKVFNEKRMELSTEQWKFDRIETITIENEKMDRLLQKKGFKDMGTFRQSVYRNGKFHDMTLWIKNL